VVSIVISIAYTHSDPAQAFFVTQTRVWEFGAGAILALLPRLSPTQPLAIELLGYAGLLVILVCAYATTRTRSSGTAASCP